MNKRTEYNKYLRFLYWIDENFTSYLNDLTFEEMVSIYIDELDHNRIDIDDVEFVEISNNYNDSGSINGE